MEIKKKTLKKAVLVIFLFMIGIIVFKNQPNPEIYSITGSVIAYSEERNTPNYQQVFSHTENAIDIFSVVYSTRPLLDQPLSIHGLLFIPQGKKNIPGVVYLPAGGGTKEGRSPLAKRIAAEGYAVLVIDQRGIGDTGGRYLSFEDDHQLFSQGEEPVQHLSVYDALAATDVLRDIKEINQNQIVMIGESMGGRYALIATALDIRIRGVIGISTAGFHIPNNPDDPGNNFMRSIDADQYIRRISPRPLIMLHGGNDSVIALQDAEITFGIASEPKTFEVFADCNHGYCEPMWESLKENLKTMPFADTT